MNKIVNNQQREIAYLLKFIYKLKLYFRKKTLRLIMMFKFFYEIQLMRKIVNIC